MRCFRRAARRGAFVTTSLLCVALAGPAIAAPPAPPGVGWRLACPREVGFTLPLADPVTDPFRAPAGPYAPGNRGLEYSPSIGTEVRAIGAGVVTFAGAIGADHYVSVRHDEHVVSSYSYLATVVVVTGRTVAAGEVLGRSSSRFQLGVRVDGAYVDPAPLLGVPRMSRAVARLVPMGTPPPSC